MLQQQPIPTTSLMLMTRMKNKFFILFTLVFCSLQLHAYEMKYVLAKTPAAYGNANSNNPKLVINDPNVGLTGAPVYSYKVNLKYNRSQLTDLVSMTAWSYTLTVVMKVKDANGNQVGATPAYNLTLTYNAITDPTSSIYEDVILYNTQYAWLNNPRAELYVTAISPVGAVPTDISLELTQIQNITETFDTSTDPNLSKTSDSKTISWNYITGAQWYELEWVYIDFYDGTQTFAAIADAFTYKEPVRIATPAQSFNFHNTYSKGAIYFRVRAVTSAYVRTNWYYNSATTITNSADFEPLKNWQTTTAFIENGRYKKSIEFADGSMRGRQSQTSMNSDNTVVITETKYDFEGRPVINVMPFPYATSTAMNYVANVNTFTVAQPGNHPKTAFDNTTGSLTLATSGGASQYYSSLNPFAANAARSYTPDAQGYPYSQVVYTPDNTGRVAKTTNVGATFKIPATPQTVAQDQAQHFVRNYYGTPSSTELYRMFGSNVGLSSHYTKTYSIDPNGVVSVSYQDAEGKVIATALNELPTNNLISVADPYNQTSLYGSSPTVYRLSSSNDVDLNAHTSISVDKIVNLQRGQSYTFNYDLNGVLDPFNGSCLTCPYTLELKITDPDGLSIIKDGSGNTIPYYSQDLIPTVAGCSTATYPTVQKTFSFIKLGEYTVSKKLYYNTASIQTLSSAIVAGESVNIMLDDKSYTDQSSFVAAYVAKKQAEANCGFTCADNCRNYMNTFQNKINPSTGTFYTTAELTSIYNQCKVNCSADSAATGSNTAASRCSSYRGQMLDQLSPGGYYYQQSGFVDGAIAQGIVFTPISGATPVTAAQVEDPNQFVPQWAIDMLPAHIEYCVYTHLCANTNTNLANGLANRDAYESFQFGSGNPITGATGWNDAATKGFLRPINMTVASFTVPTVPTATTFNLSTVPTTKLDPFFTTYAQSSTTVQNALLNYYDETASTAIDYNGDGNRTVLSAWEFASYYNRNFDGTWNSATPADYDVTRWGVFKGIYLSVKNQYVNTLVQAGCANGFQDPTLDQTVIRQEPATLNQAALTTWATGQTGGLCSDDVCEDRAQSIIRELKLSCTGLSSMTDADYLEISYDLFKYVQSGCSTNNTQMLVLSDDVTNNPYLERVNTILSGYSCDLSSVAVANPYTNCLTVTPPVDNLIPDNPLIFHIDLINDYLNSYRNLIATTPVTTNPFTTCNSIDINSLTFAPINSFPSGKANISYWNSSSYFGLTSPLTQVAITQNPTSKDIQMYFSDANNKLFFTETGLLEKIESLNLPLSSIQRISNITADSGPLSQTLTPNPINFQVVTTDGTVYNLDIDKAPSVANWTEFLVISKCYTGAYTTTGYLIPPSSYIYCTQTTTPDPLTIIFDTASARAACIAEQNVIATAEANEMWNTAVSQFMQTRLGTHYTACFSSPFKENFYYTTIELKQLYYTLYYYDQAGNLVQTVPPEGVRLLGSNAFDALGKGEYLGTIQPTHGLITHYKYNSLNQPIYKMTPDESGPSHNIPSYTFYNDKGQVVLSQNAKQQPLNTFSCVSYDKLGRVCKSGEITNTTLLTDMLDRTKYDQNVTNYWNTDLFTIANAPTDLISTTYDSPVAGDLSYTSRGRITKVSRALDLPSLNASTPILDSYITYQYDIHGNVKTLVNGMPLSSTNSSELIAFTVDYTYDLISGNVKQVVLDNGLTSQFMHKYLYDLDNRLKTTKTSRNGLVWEEDARYYYYLHGPLSRTELGEDRVQGSDYYYTLQGWIKGLNTPSAQPFFTVNGTTYNASGARDVGSDGNAVAGNVNQLVAQDEYMMNLGYYSGDYAPIATASAPLGNTGPLYTPNLWTLFSSTTSGLPGLYNGNISYWINDRCRVAASQNRDNAYVCNYDQLNRLSAAYFTDQYVLNFIPGSQESSWSLRTNTTPYNYDLNAVYDLNGNIKTLQRRDGTAQLIDNLAYKYTYQGGTQSGVLLDNKLTYITDGAASTLATYDIDGQSTGNYTYDNIGNLTGDVSEQIATIAWNREGKVASLTRASGSIKPDFVFKYDVHGKRIYKKVLGKASDGSIDNTKTTYTYYVYDGTGNVLATYDRVVDGSGYDVRQVDITVDGGRQRLGIYSYSTPVIRSNFTGTVFTNTAIDANTFHREPSKKQYELKDHLGNVRTVITGIKFALDQNLDGIVDFYTAYVVAENDYYPFGMQFSGGYRRFTTNSYRFGYNGKPTDNDWNGDGAMYDYGFRIYDPRICKFLSVDPLAPDYPELTSYQFASNSPIEFIDIDGLECGVSPGAAQAYTELWNNYNDWLEQPLSNRFYGIALENATGLPSGSVTTNGQAVAANFILYARNNSSPNQIKSGGVLPHYSSGIVKPTTKPITKPTVIHYTNIVHYSPIIKPQSTYSLVNRGGGTYSSRFYSIQVGAPFKKGAADLAAGWQGQGRYPGIDNWRNITLDEGKYVVGGMPGQSNYYTTLNSLKRSGLDRSVLFQGLQVMEHPDFGYRAQVGIYRVTGSTPAAFGTTYANPAFGTGGYPQIFIPDYSGLQLIRTIPLK
jgi:RHS repeat-associated protein